MKFYTILLLFVPFCAYPSFEQEMIDNLRTYIPMAEQTYVDLLKMAETTDSVQKRELAAPSNMIPLFEAYPVLQETVPYVPLGNLPTPVTDCPQLANYLDVSQVYIKRDDMTGKENMFGGNKVRKLEFLLADALVHNARTVITFGCAGSNHALATAVYAKEVGLDCILMLKPQWNSHVLRRNLLLDYAVGADIIFSPSTQLRGISTVYHTFMHKQIHGDFPYIIPTGGSCPRGILGFVNAAFELKKQIEAGLMPEPDKMYVPVGSAGTIVGLLVGLQAAGLNTKIIGVGVEPEEYPNMFADMIETLFEQTKTFIKNLDETFPDLSYSQCNLTLLLDFAGDDYALFTPEGVRAIELVKGLENIQLDGVYSGKAMSGMLHDVKQNGQQDEVILFWNTFCGDDFKQVIGDLDYKQLPVYVHEYFENEVQDLDK